MLNTVKPPIRDRVVFAAFEACRERGPAAVSMRDLGHTLGVSAPALYYHFENRQALLDAVADYGFGEFEKRLGAIRAKAPRARIVAVLDEYRAFAADNRKLFSLMFVEPRDGARRYPDDFSAGRSSVFNSLQAAVRGYTARKRKLDDDASLEIAHDLWALAHGHIMLWIAGRFVDEDAFRRKLKRALDRALLAI